LNPRPSDYKRIAGSGPEIRTGRSSFGLVAGIAAANPDVLVRQIRFHRGPTVQRLVNSAGKLQCAYHTGVRSGELKKIRIAQVDTIEKEIQNLRPNDEGQGGAHVADLRRDGTVD